MKRTQNDMYIDCIEFFEIIEREGYFVKYSDNRLFKHTGKKLSYFWRPNKEYIYNLINKQGYKELYPISYELINNYYKNGHLNLTDEEKIQEIILNCENNTLHSFFSDGTSIKRFLKDNIKNIFECVDKDKEKYPNAYETIFEIYYHKLVKKCHQYFKVIEQAKKMPTTHDEREFDNGEKFCYFWTINHDLILKVSELSMFKNNYPIACKIIKSAHKRNYATVNEKGMDYIQIVEKCGKLLSSKDRIRLKCGVVAFNFAKYNYNYIYKLISMEENKKLYPMAYQLLMKEKQERLIIKPTPLSNEQRCDLFFQLVEDKKRMLKQSDEDIFSDNTLVKSLLMNYRELIYNCIQLEENKEKYPLAYQIIMDDYKKHQKRIAKK